MFLLLTIFSLFSVAPKRFDVSATGKLGYYFPGTENTPYFSPDNTFSPGLGVSFNYHVFKRTTLSLGLEGVYLRPAMIDHYREPVDVTCQKNNRIPQRTENTGIQLANRNRMDV
ncbi:MAG: hypothetical protein ACK5HT_07010 [Draconibacterium sp.]